jgi:tripartite-type tricarboxylate transporter receptor subunit TctC
VPVTEFLREAAESAGLKTSNPQSSQALSHAAALQAVNAGAAKLISLPLEKIQELKTALASGESGANINNIFGEHIVHTAQGKSHTLADLALAARQPGSYCGQ